MRRFKQYEIKAFIADGTAKDITNSNYPAINEPFEKVGYSAGVYGINGGLILGKETGNLYAIKARNSMLFRYF